MKKNILAVIFILFAIFIYAQNNEPIDLLLLLNTSSGMSSSYENVNNYITGSFLSEFLRVGDTFHLIVFSQSPRLDIARRISQRGDVETIIGRMLLQYPVENGNNLAAAITFTENYVSTLPSRPKKIVLVTTGGQDITNIVSAAKNSFISKNATFDYVQASSGQPLANLPKSGRDSVNTGTGVSQSSASGAVSQGTGSVSGTASQGTGAVSSGTVSTGVSQGTGSASGTVSQGTGTASQGTGSVSSGAASTDASQNAGSASGTGSQGTAGAVQGSGSQTSGTPQSGSAADDREGTSGTVSEKTQENENESVSGKTSGNETASGSEKSSGNVKTSSGAVSGRSSASSTGIIFLFIFLILALGIIIFFISRKISSGSGSRPAAPISKQEQKEEQTQSTDRSKELANFAAVQPKQRTNPYSSKPFKPENNKQVTVSPTGTVIIKLFVEDQSFSIGKRNTHSVKSGYSLSVGGGNSDFLIFLVPVPPNIGELHRNGSQLTFIPRKPKYFPDLGSSELRDCLNKTIRIISDKNYEIRFRFELYEDPLLALNRVLHSIKVPG